MSQHNFEILSLFLSNVLILCRSSPPEVFLGKGVLKICSKFTGEHPCRSLISIKLLCKKKTFRGLLLFYAPWKHYFRRCKLVKLARNGLIFLNFLCFYFMIDYILISYAFSQFSYIKSSSHLF